MSNIPKIKDATIVANIWKPGIEPVLNGFEVKSPTDLSSPMLGSYDNIQACDHCNKTISEGCFGCSLGYIKLPKISINNEPTYLPIPYYIVPLSGLLNAFCSYSDCCTLLIPDSRLHEVENLILYDKLTNLKSMLEGINICTTCHRKLPVRYIVNDQLDLLAVPTSSKKIDKAGAKPADVQGEVKSHLLKIRERKKDLKKLGMDTDPMSYLFPGIIPVLSNIFTKEIGDKKPHPYIIFYTSILKKCQDYKDLMMRDKPDKAYAKIEEIYQELKRYMMPLSVKQKKNPHYQIINHREFVQKKEGFYQGVLLSKRSGRGARTCIIGDSCLDVDQVGVPEEIAANTTITEIVTRFNIDRIRNWIRKGIVVKDIKLSGKHKKLSNIKDIEKLDTIAGKVKIGDRIKRRIIDNGECPPDLAMINRQSTLHKSSVMVFRIKIYYDRLNFGINPSVMETFNADADGDEMNLFFISRPGTKLKAFLYMRVSKHQVGDRGNIQIGPIADSITGLWRLSRPSKDMSDRPVHPSEWHVLAEEATKGNIVIIGKNLKYQLNLIPRHQWQMIIYNSGRERWITSLFQRAALHGYQLLYQGPIPGNILLSIIFPPELYFEKKDVVIKDGILLQGRITAEILYKGSGSIKAILIDMKGVDYTLKFDKLIQDVIMTWYSFYSPYTVSIDGLVPGGTEGYKTLQYSIENYIDDITINAEKLLVEMLLNKGYDSVIAEEKIVKLFSSARTKIADMISSVLDKESGIGVMMASGAKGEAGSMVDSFGSVGLDTIYKSTSTMGRKARPTFFSHPGSTNLCHYGFIPGNLVKGLNSLEMLYASIKARKELIHTSNITPITGAAEKLLFSHMVNMRVTEDGSIKDANNQLISEQVGPLGFDMQSTIKTPEGIQYKSINYISLYKMGEKRYQELIKEGKVDYVEEDELWTERFKEDITEQLAEYMKGKG